MADDHDPLWDPTQVADDDLRRIAALLSSYRHVPTAPRIRGASAVRSRPLRAVLLASAAALGACIVGGTLWLSWRLHWPEGLAWRIEHPAAPATAPLQVGQSLTTQAGTTRVRVARIGRVDLAPHTRIVLRTTAAGHHRIVLDRGEIHARIWAPAGAFGVEAGQGEAIDLGCDYVMRRDRAGHGAITVRSGWVMHRIHQQETLVPAGSTVRFDPMRAGIPLDAQASPAFAEAVTRLDAALAAGRTSPALESAVAARASSTDAFALLSLLTRYPALAGGPLYPALAGRLGMPADDAGHRAAWRGGSLHAMNLWWEQIPRPPKAWWLNWRDAFD